MCMRPTAQNTINMSIGVTAIQILGPNPKRKAIIFNPVPPGAGSAHAISLSFRSDVALGVGMMNFVTGNETLPIITDHDIGCTIGLPWFVICGDAATPIQIVEIFYDD